MAGFGVGLQRIFKITRHATPGASGLIVGASCRLTDNKGTWFLVKPGSTAVHRSFGELSFKCDSEPDVPSLLAVKSSIKALVAGNILFGGVNGSGIDAATGAADDDPPLITVAMNSPQAKPKFVEALTVPEAIQAAVAPAAGASAPEGKPLRAIRASGYWRLDW